MMKKGNGKISEVVGDAMRHNATGGNVVEVEGDCDTWKAIAEALWGLLDDVDTAGDMFKPPINNFFKYVIRKSEERHKYLHSDGYELVLTKDGVEAVK